MRIQKDSDGPLRLMKERLHLCTLCIYLSVWKAS